MVIEINKMADMKIMQMTFMILFVFIFFTFAGLFFLTIQSGKITENYNALEKERVMSSTETIANMPELNCDSSRTLCLDEDKIITFTSMSNSYKNFWPVTSIKVTRVFPRGIEGRAYPQSNYSYYSIYDSKQKNIAEYGTFVSVCKVVKTEGVAQEVCELGRLELGIKIAS